MRRFRRADDGALAPQRLRRASARMQDETTCALPEDLRMTNDPTALRRRMEARTPFFVMGTGRCGSTRLFQLLDRHPQVALTDEARFVDYVWFLSQYGAQSNLERRAWDMRPPQELTGLVTEHFTEHAATAVTEHAGLLLGSFYERVAGRADFTHWGDKLPDARAARAVQSLYPRTRFVLVIRDPRDNYCSYHRFARKRAIAAKYPELAEMTAESFALEWRNLNAACAQYLQPLHVLRYEEMVAAPADHLDAVLAFLDLPSHPAVDARAERPKKYARHGTSATVAESVGRWRDELTPEDVAAIEATAGPVMEQFGYEPSA
ncbi:MAG: sulfotransferase family protein [Planctomycetota bacterium]